MQDFEIVAPRLEISWEFLDNPDSSNLNREFKIFATRTNSCILNITEDNQKLIDRCLREFCGTLKIVLISGEGLPDFSAFSITTYDADSVSVIVSHDYNNGEYSHDALKLINEALITQSDKRQSLIEFLPIYRHAHHVKNPTDLSIDYIVELMYDIEEDFDEIKPRFSKID